MSRRCDFELYQPEDLNFFFSDIKKLLFDKLKLHDPKFNNPKKIFFSDHHLSHASSAFFPSPFEEAIVLTADGVGEWPTTTVAIGKGNALEIKREIHFPHSFVLSKTIITEICHYNNSVTVTQI